MKVPVSIVMSDLAAKGIQYIPCFVFSLLIFFVAEVTPLKGYRADVYCSRDMYNSRTGGSQVSIYV